MNLQKAIEKATEAMALYGKQREELDEANFNKVLAAMRKSKITDAHLKSSSGYGYNDRGRDALEEVWAEVFKAEAALVRQQIVSGTHAIYLALAGNLLPGDELLALGTPYDTLQTIIGHKKHVPGSLSELGIKYREIPFNSSPDDIVASIRPQTKIFSIQRSKGYTWRESLSIAKIGEITKAIKKHHPEVIVFVDNCYGEFVEKEEPIEAGADLCAGSLIKNAGGGLTPCGGYIAGKKALIERSAAKLTTPGAGQEVGPSLMDQRIYYQGLFMAPQVVGEAIRGSVYAATLMQELGFKVLPTPQAHRTDIVQAICLETKERLLAFCQGIQKYGPVDSFVLPVPNLMPGYNHPIVMAAGTFIQGSSIELSADGPITPPYNVFLQGGLNRYHTKTALNNTLREIM